MVQKMHEPFLWRHVHLKPDSQFHSRGKKRVTNRMSTINISWRICFFSLDVLSKFAEVPDSECGLCSGHYWFYEKCLFFRPEETTFISRFLWCRFGYSELWKNLISSSYRTSTSSCLIQQNATCSSKVRFFGEFKREDQTSLGYN